VLRRLVARMLGRSIDANDLSRVIHTTVPDPTEAECDRYIRYHTSNQWGR
jgi:hypothetical protein